MREFQRSIDDMAREAELDDIKKEVEKAGRTDIRKSIERTIDPDGKLKSAFDVNEKKLPKKATKAEKLDVAKADARTDTQADDKLDAKANGSDKKPFNEDAALSDAEHDEVFEPIPELDKETVKKEPETVAPSNKD